VAEDVTPNARPALPAPTPQPLDAGDAAAAAAKPTERTSRADHARRSAYRGRFVVVYFFLAVVVGVAIGALAVALGSPTQHEAKPAGKVFQSSSTGELGAIDLAGSIQRAYRTVEGTPFVDIVATRNTLQDGNLGLLRVRYQVIQPADAATNRDSRILVPDDAIQYSLCGSGANCTIPGTATPLRGALLRREALELAVRTFQHDPAVDNVVVFLRPFQPPDGSSFEGYVLMLNRSLVERDFPTLLSRPITTTLPGAGSKITQEGLTTSQAQRIDELTRPHLYLYRYQLIGGRDALMELQPVNA
jgi:hypothetical protein